ncbi:MAG: hypothetical protein IPP10_18470 [Candidatus Competibacteraceae bacterium]|nr:hypothetical protein [Candidatus Competibacteraceae bacterium]MBK9953391.1 hypothetical protein [Candidatus Competibacteraceae bacterium]
MKEESGTRYLQKNRRVRDLELTDFQQLGRADPGISTLAGICPRRQRRLNSYRLTTDGGLPVATDYCIQHSDVVPPRDSHARNELAPPTL